MNGVDTIVYAKHAITMESDSMMNDAAIAITDGRIVAIDSAVKIDARYEPRKRIDFSHHLAMPGMINAHGHAPMIPYRGALPATASFQEVLRKYMIPMEADFCARKDFVYLSTKWALAELQSGGVTTTAEMYYFVEEMAKAFREHNIRGILGETFITPRGEGLSTGVGTHRGIPHTNLLSHIEGLLVGADDLVTFAYAPHAPYTCLDPELGDCVRMAQQLDVPILMHANETKEEVEDWYHASRSSRQTPPLVDLAEKGLLNHDKITLAHCNHLAPAEYGVLKTGGIGVAHNPICNAGLGLKTADLQELHKHGIPVGLATDGPMANDRLDLLSQLKPAQVLHRMRHGESVKFDPYTMVKMITSDAARALHRDDIGVLEAGRWADIAFIDVSDPAAQNYMRNDNPFGFLVNYAQAEHVKGTMVGGKMNEEGELDEVISELMPHLEEIAAWEPKS